MVRAWRIVKEKHASSAFDGEGARLFGGRWNPRGTPMVYTSGTVSLAALETLVHMVPPVEFKFSVISVEFEDQWVETWPPADLPAEWTVEPPPPATQNIGGLWALQARSAVLAVPSAIIPGELNYLLNPAHPDFKKIRIGKPTAFSFDSRLI